MKLARTVKPMPNGDIIEFEFVPLLMDSLNQNDVEMPQHNKPVPVEESHPQRLA